MSKQPIEKCQYTETFPDDHLSHCMAYSRSKRPDGRHWGHYPECSAVDCPLMHPELLENATLNNDKA